MCATRCLMPDSPSLTIRSALTASATSCRCTIPRTSSGWMQRGTPTVSEECVCVCVHARECARLRVCVFVFVRVHVVYMLCFVCVCVCV